MRREVHNAIKAAQYARGNIRIEDRVARTRRSASQVEERHACQAEARSVLLKQRADRQEARGGCETAEQLSQFQKCVHDSRFAKEARPLDKHLSPA